jgi:hypothetical protein
VNAYGLRGAGIWALGYDGTRPELWNVIKAKFITDTAPPVVGVRRLATAQGNPAFELSWTGTDDSGIQSWDVQASVDGGPWWDWLTGTTATTETFQGYDGHGYAFRVRARDIKGNVGDWNVTTTADIRAGARRGRVRARACSTRSPFARRPAPRRRSSERSPATTSSRSRARPSASTATLGPDHGPLTEWSSVDPRSRAAGSRRAAAGSGRRRAERDDRRRGDRGRRLRRGRERRASARRRPPPAIEPSRRTVTGSATGSG